MVQDKGIKHIVAHQDLRIEFGDKFPPALPLGDARYHRLTEPPRQWPIWLSAPPGTGFSLPAPLWRRVKYESPAPADRSHLESEARPYRYPWEYRTCHL
eukprot:8373752-Pyramimonas_sp.AAC.2